ncbi:MAG: zinc-ribbon domain-containing protein, partial [Thermodesulfobacteriota bacterium]|nr:zinc-ribbon domain-containing protein [Thermodesulfobacteriota bacterium]
MDIICQNCKGKFVLPDEKIPEGKKILIACPRCKEKISITPAIKTSPPSEEPEPVKENMPDFTEETEDVTFFEEGVKLALICENDEARRETVKNVLEDFDYHVQIAKDSQDVFKKMRFNKYAVLVLNEEFDGDTPQDNRILQYIQPMAAHIRRDLFFALFGKNFKTFDNMAAFAKSANIVINSEDLSNIKNILKNAIAENDRF